MDLLDLLRQQRPALESYVSTTSREWAACMEALQKVLVAQPDDVYDEKLWTWLASCGFASTGARGVQVLTRLLTDGAESSAPEHRLWFESQPPPPRRREGNTHLDLALGDLATRGSTAGGVEAAEGASWLCFCEMKWFSDISGRVSHDLHRNQLARVIENAIALAAGSLRVHVTLVTPSAFQNSRSRFYAYKFAEYQEDHSSLTSDLESCRLEPTYPFCELAERLSRLSLHWVSFGTLFDSMPNSELATALRAFRERFDGTVA